MGLELPKNPGMVPNTSCSQNFVAEFKVQRDWHVLVQQGIRLLKDPVPGSPAEVINSKLKYNQLDLNEKRFWISVGLPDSKCLEHINIDIEAFLESGSSSFNKEINLDSDFKVSIEVTGADQMKLSLFHNENGSLKLVQSTRIRSKLTPHFQHLVPYGSGVLSVSPGGELLCVGSSDGWLGIVDSSNGKILRRLNGHIGDISSVKFFPSGQVVLSGGSDFRAKVFGVDGECPVTLSGRHHRAITNLAMVGRGRYSLTSSLDGQLNYWKVADESCVHTIAFEEPICHMSIHVASDFALLPSVREAIVIPEEEGGDCILVVGISRKLFVYDLVSGKELLLIPTDLSLSCACKLDFPGSCLCIAMGSENGEVSVVAIGNKGYSSTRICKSDSRVSALYTAASGFWAAYGKPSFFLLSFPFLFSFVIISNLIYS
ncbi:hypothetical protein DSO57_1013192 [Entomophthora muscae]|uniref:Uncharacterized protein n=1 Tax=Entomophthora muscae TaxID=34485 RepID=A0ACC2RKN0_9FUNG|nr:hypothetical protein DSO57_1013192 [Entomophthora muscae]